MASAASASSQAALDNATRASTSSWQADLKVLFDNARDRFADVVWEFQPDPSKPSEEVWGHKAVVYARAPPAFQQRYFAFRPAPVSSPTPYSSSPIPPISSVSLGIDLADPSRSPSPYGMRGASPTPSAMPGTLMRLHPQIDVSLFTHELEYLYTGVGFGEAFEFLFDALDGADRPVLGGGADAEHLRVEKLRHDLNYMWRSRLYSDVRLSLTGNWSSTPSGAESSTALFSAHRFVLASRSNYFKNALSGGFAPLSSTNIGGPVTLTLPSPPFTPASLHFTLGYLYTGTLVFSHRTYDLDTAFAILRSASFLALGTLHNEVEARIVDEMMHGLNLAYVPFTTYETLTGGRWGVAGCKCRQCARRAPRVLAFALEPEVRNALLENGARRALGTLFGEGWVTQEFAALPPKLRSSLLSGLAKRAKGNGTQNVFALLQAVGAGLKRCDKEVADLGKKRVAVAAGKKSTKAEDLDDAWVATVREALIHARASIDKALCGAPAEAFEADDWLVLLEGDGVAFDDRERVEGVMASLVRGLTPANAGIVYQTLVSSILLRPHPSDANTSLLDPSSALRSLIEDTRKEILGWLAKNKNWTKVRDAQGFDPLEEWARKEILDELELSSDDLTTPTSSTPARPITRTGLRPVMPRSGIDFDSASMASASTSLRRELGPGFDTDGTGTDPGTDRADTDSVHSTSTAGPHARALSPGGTTLRTRDKTTGANKAQAVAARRTGVSLTTPAGGSGTKSLAASVDGMSVGSGVGASGKKVVQASAAGPSTPAAPAAASGSGTGTGAPTRKLPPTPSPVPDKRPVSVASTAATRSSVYKTAAATTGVRSRTTSVASTNTVNTRNKAEGVSPNLAVNTTFLTPTVPRQRTTSAASASSVASARSAASAASRASVSATPKKAPVTRGAPTPSPTTKTGPARGSTATPSPIPTGKLGSASRPTTPKNTPKPGAAGTRQRAASTASTRSIRAGKEKEEKSTKPPVPALPKVPLRKPEPPTDADGDVFMEDPPSTASTVRLKRKGSNDTITFDSSGPSSSAGQAPPRPESIAERDEAHTRTLKARPIGLSKYFDEPTSSATAPNFPLPSGVTLNVGIPCIITSRRQRMKAFARYIGEVAGEAGPWIGVEVPIGASWGGERLDGRAWNDGSWGGVHYFDVGVDDYADMARSGASFRRGTKREGESLSIEAAKRMRSASPAMSDISTTESRGLFVRPQQVLYVVQSESAWRNDDS